MNPARKLLLLHTGGTIGMQAGSSGLAPAAGFESRLCTALSGYSQYPLPAWQYRELLPLLDSANLTQANWLAMRDAILHAVEEEGCDAVLVLHGTDTLAYSAAALSFLLLGLDVPVLLTGSMQPAGVEGSDAWPNLFGALDMLSRGVDPGVWVHFAGRLLPGTRVSKRSSEDFDAFAETGRPRRAFSTSKAPATGLPATGLPATLDYRNPRQPVVLAVLPLFPGIAAKQLRGLLESGVQALLLECYGSGTGPANDAELLEVLRAAQQRGVVLAAISQCPQGAINFDLYAAGSALAGCGVLSGAGMGREAALGKLFSLLGVGLPPAEVERLFAVELCGELGGKSAMVSQSNGAKPEKSQLER
jgi:L-asparaginase